MTMLSRRDLVRRLATVAAGVAVLETGRAGATMAKSEKGSRDGSPELDQAAGQTLSDQWALR
jgi:hypothetical protein